MIKDHENGLNQFLLHDNTWFTLLMTLSFLETTTVPSPLEHQNSDSTDIN